MKSRSVSLFLAVAAVIGIAVLLAILLSPKPPVAASNPTPEDGAKNVVLEPVLTWTAGERAVTHQLCLGTMNPPPVVTDAWAKTEYKPDRLAPATTYFWQVNEIGKSGALTPGPVWSFTTRKPEPPPPPKPPVKKVTPPKPPAPAPSPAAGTETAAKTETAPDPDAWAEQPEAEFGPGDALFSGNRVKVYLGDHTVKKGETFDVRVNLTAPPLESFSLVLTFDPAALEIVPDSGRPVGAGFRQMPQVIGSQEKAVVVIVSNGTPGGKNLNATEGVCVVKFKMRAKAAGETNIRPGGTGCSFTNGSGKNEHFEITGGRVLVR